MTKQWKVYQKIYQRLNKDNKEKGHVLVLYNENILQGVKDYLLCKDSVVIYPAKAYVVAIIYARLINEIYGDDFYSLLNDPMLLMGQTPHFKTFQEDPVTYREILDYLATVPNWIELGWCPETVRYFKEECTKEGIEKLMQTA